MADDARRPRRVASGPARRSPSGQRPHRRRGAGAAMTEILAGDGHRRPDRRVHRRPAHEGRGGRRGGRHGRRHARGLRSRSTCRPTAATLVDIVGTGGGPSRRAHALNVSTMACFVAAGAGVHVCKHGNRKASSTSGSFDLLEALGVGIDLDGPGVARCVVEAGVGFCFARAFHPAMRHAGPVRAELGIPTVFNFLGPAVEPGPACDRQVIGVNDPAMAPTVIGVLQQPGCAAGHGRARPRRHGRAHHHRPLHGLGAARRRRVTSTSSIPRDLGLEVVDVDQRRAAATPQANAAIARRVLRRRGRARTATSSRSTRRPAWSSAGVVDDLGDAASSWPRASIDAGSARGRRSSASSRSRTPEAWSRREATVRRGLAAGAAPAGVDAASTAMAGLRPRTGLSSCVDVDQAAGPLDLGQLGLRGVEQVELVGDALEHLGRGGRAGPARGGRAGRAGSWSTGARPARSTSTTCASSERSRPRRCDAGVAGGDDEVLVELDRLVLELAAQLVDRERRRLRDRRRRRARWIMADRGPEPAVQAGGAARVTTASAAGPGSARAGLTRLARLQAPAQHDQAEADERDPGGDERQRGRAGSRAWPTRLPRPAGLGRSRASARTRLRRRPRRAGGRSAPRRGLERRHAGQRRRPARARVLTQA